MKNKQVKQMMCDTHKGQWFLIGGNGQYIKNFGVRFFEFGITVPMDATVSLTAMDHWLFLKNHKIEKESWQVTIK